MKWVIEMLECGVWETLDVADDLETCLELASSYCNTVSEDRLRISTPTHEIL